MNKILNCLFCLSPVLLLTTNVNAALILQYNSASSTTNPTLSASIADAAILADNFTAAGGLTAKRGSTYNWRGWDTGSNNFAQAVTANDFFQWGFDITATLTTLELSTMDIHLDRSSSGPDNFEIQASINGGAGNFVLAHDFADTHSALDFLSVDLSMIPDLASGDSIVFTLAAFNSESLNGTFDIEGSHKVYGDITQTPVPVPAAIWLFGSGLIAFIGMRRKQS